MEDIWKSTLSVLMISLLFPIILLLKDRYLKYNFNEDNLSISEAQNYEMFMQLSHLKVKYNFFKPISIIPTKLANHHIISAHGSRFLPITDAVLISGMFIDLNPHVKEFLFAHELSHLKNDDFSRIWFLTSLFSIFTTILFGSLFHTWANNVFDYWWISIFWGFISYSSLIGILIWMTVFIIASQKMEKRADLDAFKVCSHDAKLQSIEFFTELQLCSLEIRSQNWYHKLLFKPMVT